MPDLRFTLLGEGTSDRALLSILRWLLQQHIRDVAIQGIWADLSRLPRPPRSLAERIARAVELYPCDVLFVHRDSDRENRASRVDEVARAVTEASRLAASTTRVFPPVVPVVPVRMLEAWLLTDEVALRRAAGNPNGRVELDLPRARDLERVLDPKAVLQRTVLEASGLHGRRLQRLAVSPVRIAELTDDFSALRALPAFQALEQEIVLLISKLARRENT